MLALRVRQKEAEFYLASVVAGDLLRKVRFQLRSIGEAQAQRSQRRTPDNTESFIAGVVGSTQGFQRRMIARKVREIRDFIGLSDGQPPIPATVLLYTGEQLEFSAQAGAAGDLAEPREPFTVIDGQHRLAGLQMYIDEYPDQADDIQVPVAIFDGKAADFAAEMFVTVNSKHAKIAKSLLIDLMENVKGAPREQRVAARVTRMLYDDGRSPLRYRVNRLGGRSGQAKWILQSQVYNELHRIIAAPKPPELVRFVHERLRVGELGETPHRESDKLGAISDGVFRIVAAWYRAAARAFGSAWGSDKHMVTVPVTLQAMARVLGEQLRDDGLVGAFLDAGEDEAVLRRALDNAWGDPELWQDFRKKGFYERFAAKGSPERVRVIQRRLAGLVEA